MSSQDRDDNLDSLLESLSDDQEIEKKMEDFARNKERIERIQRARETSAQFQETYSSASRSQKQNAAAPEQNVQPDAGHMIDPSDEDDVMPSFMQQPSDAPVLTPGSDDAAGMAEGGMTRRFGEEPAAAADGAQGGSTRVFTTASQPEEVDEADQTRRMTVSSDEIQGLLDQDEPILTREYVSDNEDSYDDFEDDYDHYQPHRTSSAHRAARPVKKKTNWRVIGVVAGIAAAIALLGTGAYMVSSFINNPITSAVSGGYDKLLSWAKAVTGVDADSIKSITDFKSIYDKLSEDEKRKINEVLIDKTGKTFDELLAQVNTQEKPSASNENVANAERKADLRSQIEQLSGEVNGLQSQLDDINRRSSAAENTYNSKNNAYVQAQNATAAAQNEVGRIQNELNAIPTADAINAQIDALRNQNNTVSSSTSTSDSSNPGHSGGGQQNNQNNADIQAQISDLQSQLARRNELEGSLSSANNAVADCQSKEASAKSEADSAYGAWQAILAEASPIQGQIDAKNSQIAQLQQEYDSID